jgi:hypothetical protein
MGQAGGMSGPSKFRDPFLQGFDVFGVDEVVAEHQTDTFGRRLHVGVCFVLLVVCTVTDSVSLLHSKSAVFIWAGDV